MEICNNRIGANGFLNWRCVYAPDIESILLAKVRKIFLQQYLPRADVAQEDVMDTSEMDRARRRSLMNVSPNWRASSSREFINVLHSRSQEIKKIDVLEFTGLANTQQN